MFISIWEIIDIIIMTAVSGYIFMGVFQKTGFTWNAFKDACILTAPGLVFHELAHKFVGLALGLQATFHAAYTWLGIGMVLKLLNTGFIFFIPGYVSISEGASPGVTALVAFAGPFLNLVLFIVASAMLKKHLSQRRWTLWYLTKQINLWLFILNMLPFPFADGFKVYAGLWSLL